VAILDELGGNMIDIKAIEERCRDRMNYKFTLLNEDLPALLEAVKEAEEIVASFLAVCRFRGWDEDEKWCKAWLEKIGGE
jgi:hypothetical protein